MRFSGFGIGKTHALIPKLVLSEGDLISVRFKGKV